MLQIIIFIVENWRKNQTIDQVQHISDCQFSSSIKISSKKISSFLSIRFRVPPCIFTRVEEFRQFWNLKFELFRTKKREEERKKDKERNVKSPSLCPLVQFQLGQRVHSVHSERAQARWRTNSTTTRDAKTRTRRGVDARVTRLALSRFGRDLVTLVRSWKGESLERLIARHRRSSFPVTAVSIVSLPTTLSVTRARVHACTLSLSLSLSVAR